MQRRYGEVALADVENDDPHKTDQHEPEHDGLEPHGVGCVSRRGFADFFCAFFIACHSSTSIQGERNLAAFRYASGIES